MPELQLSFHGTFALKKEDLRKILQAATEVKGLKDNRDGLMKRTGLGNEKVLRIKSWAIRSGLVRNDFLSPEGKLVLDHDPLLESPITDWFMHFYLSLGDKGLAPPPAHPADWGGWTYFIYQFLPQNPRFTTENLVYDSSTIFEQETSKKLEKNFRYVLRAYTEPDAIATCEFIQAIEPNRYQAGQANLPNTYLIGYILAKLWERDFPNSTSVLTDDLLNHPMGLTPVLGLEPDTAQEQLDKLESLALIEQRRSVPPFQVVRRWDDPLELLEKAYTY